MYQMGQGVPQDYVETVKWYRKAADQCYAVAQYFLGVMYIAGQGVQQDHAEAVKLYRKAAEQGYAVAQYILGINYLSSLGGISRDLIKAHMWTNLAASRYPSGKTRDEIVEMRDLIAKRMTPDQIVEAQRLARKWKPKKKRKCQ